MWIFHEVDIVPTHANGSNIILDCLPQSPVETICNQGWKARGKERNDLIYLSYREEPSILPRMAVAV